MTPRQLGLRHAGVYCGTPEERIAVLEAENKKLKEDVSILREDVATLADCLACLTKSVLDIVKAPKVPRG